MHKTDPRTISEATPKKRIHYRSILIVLFFVVVPWCLIAIPGASLPQRVGNEFVTPGGNHVMVHGWPACHLVTLKSAPTKNASDRDEVNARLGVFDDLFIAGKRRAFREVWMDERFWSNPERWPSRYLLSSTTGRTNFFYRVNLAGLFINLACLLVVIWGVTVFCERRIRRRKHLLKLTLFEMLLLLTLASVSFFWIGNQNSRAKNEDREFNKLKAAGISYTARKYDALPAPISRLLDYVSKPPWIHPSAFRRVEAVIELGFPIDSTTLLSPDPQEFALDPMAQRRQLLNEVDLPLHFQTSVSNLPKYDPVTTHGLILDMIEIPVVFLPAGCRQQNSERELHGGWSVSKNWQGSKT